MAQGALTFGANATDNVSFGAGTGLTDLDPFTFIAYVFPTTLTTARKFYMRGSAAVIYKQVQFNGTGGNVACSVARLTANSSYITSDTPLSGTGVWYCLAATFSSAASPVTTIYSSPIGTAPALRTCGTTTDGTGTVTVEVTAVTRYATNNAATPAQGFQGRFGPTAVFNAVLSAAEIASWAQIPRLTVGSNVAVAFGRPGKNGADWIEYTANTGAVTGATQSDGPPVGGYWTRQGNLIVRAA